MNETAKSVTVKRLMRTRELLSDSESWTQGYWRSPKGGYCLSGAHMAAEGNRYSRQVIVSAIFDLGFESRCLDDYGHKLSSIPHIMFNDDPDTTHADILAVLDRAIQLATEETSDA